MKELSNIFDKEILTPSERKLNFLYVNLCNKEKHRLVVGTHPDTVEYGNPQEGLGILEFINTEKFHKFWSYLSDELGLFSYHYSFPVYNLSVLNNLIKTHKGKSEKIKQEIHKKAETDQWEKLMGMYLLDKAEKETTVCKCIDEFNSQRLEAAHDELVLHLENLGKEETEVEIENIKESLNKNLRLCYFRYKGNPYRTLLIKGVEILMEKKPFKRSILFWLKEKTQLLWCNGYTESPEVKMIAGRPNVFIIT